jgi:uncharacterized tellurite resistance protein B-like protein
LIPEPIPFLANIISVAYADGQLSASELGQLDAIRSDFKFKKSDYNSAVKLVEEGNHQLIPIGSFADKVKNLELMLRVALADNDLDKTEVTLLLQFCKVVGVTQEQLTKIRCEVLNTLKQQNKICPSCSSSSDASSQFCSNCGLNYSESKNEKVQVDLKIPSSGLAIEFAESTGASFPKALEIAKSSNEFQNCKKNKKNWYLAVYKSGKLNDALPLVEALSGLRNREVHWDGKNMAWDEVFGFAWCASERSTAYEPSRYCFGKGDNKINPWGCMEARMDWTEWADWFRYGAWEKAGILGSKQKWRFDKKRILHELKTKLNRFRFCPHIQPEFYEAVVKHLPETVSPDSDKHWSFHRSYEQVPGAIKKVIEEIEDDYTIRDEFWADGVQPKGLGSLEGILSKAFKETGNHKISIKQLLK